MRNYFEMSVYQFTKKLKRWVKEFAEKPLSPVQALFILAISIFVAESVVIFVLFVLPGLSRVSEMFVDSFVLVVLVSPALYFFIYRSFVLHIAERKRAEEELKAKQSEIEELNANLEKRVQEELKKSRQKDLMMMHQSRLAATGEMIGNIAHQWKQPLNALSILLYNIKDLFDDKKSKSDNNEPEEENVDDFIENGTQLIMKMATTIDDFSNFFKPNRKKEEFSINKSVKESLALVDASFKYNNISVVLNEQEEIRIVGFSNEYSQVILNILNNAKDAIVAREMDGQIKIDLLQEKSSTVVKIRDNGGGIPEKILPKIFYPYFTTKGEIKGTGIGLYMSKMIIEEHMNGYLDVQNVNNGAEFKISTAILKKEKRNTIKEVI